MTQTKAELLQTRHQGDIRLGDANSSHYVGFKAPATVSSSLVWTLPAADGSANQFLKTNASGVLSWGTVDTSTLMPLGGGTFTGNVTYADNVKAIFGSSTDLEIYHSSSGNDSYIDNNKNKLYIRCNVDGDDGGDIHIQAKSTENSARFVHDGTVELFYDGAKKIETTATGVAITGAATISTDLTVTGDLTVSGTTTTINTQTLDVEDKNVVIGKVSSPSDTTADGGGITLKGASDKTINWINSTDAWTFSEHINIASGKKLGVGGANYGTSGQVLTSGGSSTHPSWTTISAAPQITANASGALAAGDLVVANSNGTVSKIKNTYTEKSSYSYNATGAYAGGTAFYQKVCHDSTNGRLYTIYKSGTRTKLELSISDGAYNNWSDYQEIVGNDGKTHGVAWSETSQRGLAVFTMSTGLEVRAFKLDAGGDSVTFGTKLNVLGGGLSTDHVDISWDKTADKFLIVVGKNASDNFPDASGARNNTIAFVVSVNDVTCTRGTPTVMSSQDNEGRGLSLAYDPDNNKHLAIYADSGNSNYLTACILTVSGTTVTANTEVAGGGQDGNIAAYDTDVVYVGGGDFVFYYHQTDNDTKARFVTVSGTTPSMGKDTGNINDTLTGYINNNIQAVYDERTEKVAIGQLSHTGPRDTRMYILTLNKTNHTISNISSSTGMGSSRTGLAGCYDSTNNTIQWLQTNNNDTSTSRSYSTVDVTTNLGKGYIGVSSGTFADGAAATINVVGNTDSNQSGLTAGVKYFINNDGTLGTIGGDTKVFAGTAVSATKIIINEGPQDYSPMVLLEEKRLSNESNPSYTSAVFNIDFTGFVSDEYDSYILKIYNLSRNPPSMTDAFNMHLKWFFDGTLYSASTYYWDATGRGVGASGLAEAQGSATNDGIKCQLNNTMASWTGEMEFPNLGKDNAQKVVMGRGIDQKNPWSNGQAFYFNGKEKNSSNTNENKCTGFRLILSNDCTGGRLKLYGLK